MLLVSVSSSREGYFRNSFYGITLCDQPTEPRTDRALHPYLPGLDYIMGDSGSGVHLPSTPLPRDLPSSPADTEEISVLVTGFGVSQFEFSLSLWGYQPRHS